MEQCNNIIAKIDLYRKTGFGTQSMEIFCTKEKFTPETPYPQYKNAEVRFQTMTKEISHEQANDGGYLYRTSHFSASDAHYDEHRNVVILKAMKFDETGKRID